MNEKIKMGLFGGGFLHAYSSTNGKIPTKIEFIKRNNLVVNLQMNLL